MGIPSICKAVLRLAGLEWVGSPVRHHEVPATPLPDPLFRPGDWVILKKENPYKGTLTCGKRYRAGRVITTHMQLWGDNGTMGYYDQNNFQLLGYDPSGADEYDDIMAIQELME